MHLGPQAKILESLGILNTLTLVSLLQTTLLQIQNFLHGASTFSQITVFSPQSNSVKLVL